MNETTERFFAEIAAHVGYDRVTELHLFSGIRQGGVESGVAVVAADPERAMVEGIERHVVYTARYRHTLKGPNRGKWEFDIKAEADAPLLTVDEVVRGVAMRSGDDVQAERVSGDQLRTIVPAPEAPEPEPALPEPPDTPSLDTVPASEDPGDPSAQSPQEA